MTELDPATTTLGIVGAGTMGSGIALAALYHGFSVRLYDVVEDARQNASTYLQNHLDRKGLGDRLDRVALIDDLDRFSEVDFVIEAAPEDLGIKQELFARLDALCPPTVPLATNTSTLSVTVIAAATSNPGRVGGMHFFNPAAVRPLVEVIEGADTEAEVLARLVSLASALGKTPVVVRDTPGFIVNRVARPFYGEALRLLGEGAADVETIDRLVEGGGRFRMGPFRLMDLIGIDINLAAMQSMYEQTFGEPRYRPHWIQARMVQQSALGRKTGRGFYTYPETQPEKPAPEPEPKPRQAGRGNAFIVEDGWGPGIRDWLSGAGLTCTDQLGERPEIAVVAVGEAEQVRQLLPALEAELEADVPILCQAANRSVAESSGWMHSPERLIGFDGLFVADGAMIHLVAPPRMAQGARERLDTMMLNLGRVPLWTKDSPALVLPRIVAMLANEAAFAVGEGVADARTIDRAMRLGVSYPLGPLEWMAKLGVERVLHILEHLQREYGEERYRPAPMLRRWARTGASSVDGFIA